PLPLPSLQSVPTRRSSDLLVASSGSRSWGIRTGVPGTLANQQFGEETMQGRFEVFLNAHLSRTLLCLVVLLLVVTVAQGQILTGDRKSTRLNSSHGSSSYA